MGITSKFSMTYTCCCEKKKKPTSDSVNATIIDVYKRQTIRSIREKVNLLNDFLFPRPALSFVSAVRSRITASNHNLLDLSFSSRCAWRALATFCRRTTLHSKSSVQLKTKKFRQLFPKRPEEKKVNILLASWRVFLEYSYSFSEILNEKACCAFFKIFINDSSKFLTFTLGEVEGNSPRCLECVSIRGVDLYFYANRENAEVELMKLYETRRQREVG